MKLTATQLRQIIKEEFMNQASKKKSDAVSKFDSALKSSEDGEGVSKEFFQLVDKAISAIKSGKSPMSVVKALQSAVASDDGRGVDDDISEIVAAVAQKDPSAGKKLNQALDDQYEPDTVGYMQRHGNSGRY